VSDARNILIVDPVHPVLFEKLSEHYKVTQRITPDSETLKELISQADAIVIRSGVRLTADILNSAPRLRVIARAGAGIDNIDLQTARARRICVFNVPDSSSTSVAEFTFALILAVARKVALADRQIRLGQWRKAELCGLELNGKTIGIVGLGRIGTHVCRIARGFGMRVIASVGKPIKDRISAAAAEGIEMLPNDAVLRNADVVSLHVPLTDETKHLINAEAIDTMKRSAILVNVSRGGVVDERALEVALRNCRIVAAATDVFVREGQPSPLLGLDNLVATPHIGAMTEDAQRRIAEIVQDNLVRALKGEKVVNRVA